MRPKSKSSQPEEQRTRKGEVFDKDASAAAAASLSSRSNAQASSSGGGLARRQANSAEATTSMSTEGVGLVGMGGGGGDGGGGGGGGASGSGRGGGEAEPTDDLLSELIARGEQLRDEMAIAAYDSVGSAAHSSANGSYKARGWEDVVPGAGGLGGGADRPPTMDEIEAMEMGGGGPGSALFGQDDALGGELFYVFVHCALCFIL